MYRPVQNEKPKVIMTSGVNVIKDCHNAEFDGFEVSRVEVSYILKLFVFIINLFV